MLPDNAQQCSFCGEVLEDNTTQPANDKTVDLHEEEEIQTQPEPKPAPAETPAETSAPATPRKTKNGNGPLYAIIGILSAIIAFGLIWFLFINPDKGKDNATNNPEEPALVEGAQQDANSATANEGINNEQTAEEQEPDLIADDDLGCYLGYVTVTGEDVRLRESPEINNHNIIKDRRGKNLHPKKGERLPCMDAENGFYYVDFHGMPCFISQQFAVLSEE